MDGRFVYIFDCDRATTATTKSSERRRQCDIVVKLTYTLCKPIQYAIQFICVVCASLDVRMGKRQMRPYFTYKYGLWCPIRISPAQPGCSIQFDELFVSLLLFSNLDGFFSSSWMKFCFLFTSLAIIYFSAFMPILMLHTTYQWKNERETKRRRKQINNSNFICKVN